jgi:hypothetical protein
VGAQGNVEDTFRAGVKDTEQVEAAMVGRRQSKGLGVRVGARKGNRGGTEGSGRRSTGDSTEDKWHETEQRCT